MANFFTDAYGQIGAIWKKLTTGQKMMIMVVGLAMGAGLFGVVYWSSRVEMSVLYSNLPQEDAAAMQAKLEELSVPYDLSAGGTTILVPKERKYELMNRLALEGLPRGNGQGMEIFDTLQLGMTEFLQNVNLTRAKEGELARIIAWLDPVAAAKVVITRPKPTVFTELERVPTAAVVLRLVPGRVMSQHQVMGIAHVVACAVEGLEPENVKIVDTSSKLLSRTMDNEEEQLVGSQLEIKRRYETALMKKVQEQLDGVVGPNKVKCLVDVDLDFQKQTMKSKEYTTPTEGKIVVKEKVNTQDTTSTTPGNGGATGTADKVAQGPAGAQLAEKSNTEDSEREYAVNETDTDMVIGGATVKRLSLAIMVDKTLQDKDPSLPTNIEDIVKRSVGFSETRGDESTLAILEFTVPESVEDPEGLESYEQKEFIFTLVKYGIQGLSVAGVLGVLWFVLRRAEKKVAGGTAQKRGAPLDLAEDRQLSERKKIREEVVTAVQTDPLMASEILHEWLQEEDK